MRVLLLLSIVFLLSFSKAYTQVTISETISEEQLEGFKEVAELKKNQFIKCIERISRNTDLEMRKNFMEMGVNLFIDTAHVQVSNIRNNTIRSWTINDYFYKVVASYYNPVRPVTISFKADKIIIDKFIRNAEGQLIGIQGHFTFTQDFCRCQDLKSKPISEVKEYALCYCDRTTKTGLITIKPMNSPTGITWEVLLSGIVVDDTTER